MDACKDDTCMSLKMFSQLLRPSIHFSLQSKTLSFIKLLSLWLYNIHATNHIEASSCLHTARDSNFTPFCILDYLVCLPQSSVILPLLIPSHVSSAFPWSTHFNQFCSTDPISFCYPIFHKSQVGGHMT